MQIKQFFTACCLSAFCLVSSMAVVADDLEFGASEGLLPSNAYARVATAANSTKIKNIARIEGVRENYLSGYGIVVGLSGSGDSRRNQATVQSVANMLTNYGVNIRPEDVRARNVAAVMVTATLPPYSQPGDKIDINVASVADAQSLLGGTLLMTPLYAPNRQLFALSQGPLSVGGFRFDSFGNVTQKNHATVGTVPDGAVLEQGTTESIVSPAGTLYLLLKNPDYTTASRITDSLANFLGEHRRLRGDVRAISASRVAIRLTDQERVALADFLRGIENLPVVPAQAATVVVNERTGTVVAGGDVKIGAVTVSQGALEVTIDTRLLVSQPSLLINPGAGINTAVVPQSDIVVEEPTQKSVSLPAGTTIGALVAALNRLKIGSRDMIAILQGIDRAGALNAELIIQ